MSRVVSICVSFWFLSSCGATNVTQSVNIPGLGGGGESASAPSAASQQTPINVTVSPVITNNNQISNDTHVSQQTTNSNLNQNTASSSSSAMANNNAGSSSSDSYSKDALCRANAGNPSLAAMCAR